MGYFTRSRWFTASELNANPVLDYIFRVHGSYFVHVLMHCNIKEPTPGLRDTFQLFIDYPDLYVHRDWNEQQLLGQEPSRLFSDLITKSPFSSKALDNRLRGLNVPKEAPFTLYAFLSATESADNQLLLFYLRKLKEAFPRCHIGVYGPHVLALDAEGGLEPNGSQMQALASAYPCVIGMSAPFGHLSEFTFAYRQVKSAIELTVDARQTLASSHLDNHTALVHQFDRGFASYIADATKNNNQLVTHFVERRTIARILYFDKQHGTDDARILFFLVNERKVSAAREALFMHRNTLLYRIGKMQGRFSFDLNDFPTRQRLLMEYFLLPAPTTTSDR